MNTRKLVWILKKLSPMNKPINSCGLLKILSKETNGQEIINNEASSNYHVKIQHIMTDH